MGPKPSQTLRRSIEAKEKEKEKRRIKESLIQAWGVERIKEKKDDFNEKWGPSLMSWTCGLQLINSLSNL